ncbi:MULTISPECIES: SMP-30/gluconolactonase/LRE family protein [Pseudonocardia]|uniref:L-arabinolactonase n=2 Tax=Pseudonocardia TaxID=1847 RepID=A0A1Y2MUL6_PSEAH|nr:MULTISPECIES: SMP-30/gluconolactonase/LRE family protein [Pseudonocardia]OSY38880.1 L-arabinolactonase [Pseudonocardia autotrophica]TDN76136.1 sugar lactone lactonase YvrE [Pseudonocardia autotrophica]BBG00117.1 gluconolactonase [Pseudonocardia autotrophica]GEC26082.1 gluconolactonase [Pseudonocardia saturnea]
MTRELVAEQLTGPVAEHGEGPVWHPSFAGVRWVDMLAGDILELADDRIRRTHVGSVAAAFRPRRDGGLVLADERGFVLLDPDLRVQRRLGDLWDDPGIRMNEGGCDPAGAFWCGSMAYDTRPGAGTLYRLGPDLVAEPALTGVTISNGLVFTPDGRRAYYIDTPTGRIDVFDVDPDAGAAALRDRRPAVLVDPAAGLPDGLTVDSAGALWVALWGGSAVHRYTPDGVLDTVVRLPVSRVTACTFGGPDLGTLFVTSSRQELTADELTAQPAAGALFAVRPGTGGAPVAEFSG